MIPSEGELIFSLLPIDDSALFAALSIGRSMASIANGVWATIV